MNYNDYSHNCCWKQKQPPACGLPFKHKVCCLCGTPAPKGYDKEAEEKKVTPRTSRQNRALRLYFALLATELNAAGLSIQFVLKEKVDLDWSPDSVLELLWRPLQKALLKKHSTTLLNKTEDIDKVYETLNRHLGTIFGLHVPFPHYESEQEYIKATVELG